LADSSKIGRQHLISFAPVDAVDELVTDTEIDDTDCKELTDNGIEVVTA
ncbi:MAG: D-beta-D-heptose 1-phosphate adenosyltransferase, partial [Rhodococcus sp. (in: high G+C Gram-positive bacteria)]|nr:D-beta-D-heptose 1-phosphate adenosyltransferase [Rhodococcus sp. (in: high G+C Gram-positive bacteria)]MDX5455552.1 D-beta-D-heptose 1-phosphate adenosyltransferase [Rhodococcus sp. (in: high G+C Gram-positive bacteria)]